VDLRKNHEHQKWIDLWRFAMLEVGQRIEFATGRCDSGIGLVTVYNEETEMVTVVDEDDGTVWTGLEDYTTAF
jgi:hypothetical protein